jgi:hypothetical protein
MGHVACVGTLSRKKCLLPVLGIKPWLLGCLAHSLVSCSSSCVFGGKKIIVREVVSHTFNR